jgi:hypothetical protein
VGTMPPRRTRRGDPEPENRPAKRNQSSGSGRGRKVENLGRPPKRVRGGPQPRWPREGPAVRPPAHGCRGRAGRRNAFGQAVEPPGRSPDRDRATAGRSAADGRRGGSTVEPDSECQVDRIAPAPSGVGEARWTRVPSGTSGRVGFGDGALTDAPTFESGPDPSGWGSGSSDGTIRRVDVERRGGSEELTGSPEGYSGPLSRFPTCSSHAELRDAGKLWTQGT